MPRYRKLPVEIDALHYDGEWGPVIAWLHELSGVPEGSLLIPVGARPAITRDPETQQLVIETLEGVMRADIGDYVICGVKRELYPCKPDIFEATYEAVAEPVEEEPLSARLVFDLLSLVKAELPRGISITEVQTWTNRQWDAVVAWASAVHLQASDNDDVEVPDMPAVLR